MLPERRKNVLKNAATGRGCVTVRERDSMEQVRLPIAELEAYIAQRVEF